MNLSDITTKAWILALFKRDDGERFLLGDGYYDFKDSLQHFQPNSMSNDIVELQGADGQLLAGQVRRSGTQSFDGYIGDGTTNRKIVEQRRKAFLMFFRKKHYYTVVYIFCDGTAIKRERGYLVDAPSVPEIRQKSPEYHVALNFENVNYYEYAENAQGEEIYSNVREIVVSNIISGGLVWDALGAVSEALQWGDYTTESGSFITLNDVIQNAPMSLDSIYGNTTQQTYSGKNLASLQTSSTLSIDGVAFSIVDGVININGTTPNTNKNFFWDSFQVPQNGTAIFWADITGYTDKPSDQAFMVLQVSDDDSTWSNLLSINFRSNSTHSYTTTLDTTKYYRIRWYVSQNTFTNATIKVQLEYGSTKTSFEPYVGGIPAPNPSYPQNINTVTGEQTLTVTDGINTNTQEINLGKNLLDLSADTTTSGGITWTSVDNTISGSGTITSTWAYISSKKDLSLPVGTYTLSFAEAISSPIRVQIILFYTDGTNITRTVLAGDKTASVTTEKVANAYRLAITGTTANTSIDISVKDVQFELGSKASDFAPYFTPIELCKIGTYQDYIWNDNGTWKVHKETGKVVYDGSETWNVGEGGGIRRYITPNDATMIQEAGRHDILSDYYSYGASGNRTGAGFVNGGRLYLYWGTMSDDVNTFKTWLSTHPTTVFYQLETPTTTEITDSTLLEQLEHIYQLYGGLNNISIVGAGNGSIEIRYATVLNPGGGFVWEDGGTGGLTTITIDAVDLTLPVWTITGPATNPTLSNITTGQTMSWLGTVPSGQTLIIDMNEQTATMAGANVYAFLSGNWVGLAPGTNRISYSVTGTDEASTLSWNNIVG